jgi:hypothetical protein
MPSEKLTVLAVDDEPEVVELYRKILGTDASGDLDILGGREDSPAYTPMECRSSRTTDTRWSRGATARSASWI